MPRYLEDFPSHTEFNWEDIKFFFIECAPLLSGISSEKVDIKRAKERLKEIVRHAVQSRNLKPITPQNKFNLRQVKFKKEEFFPWLISGNGIKGHLNGEGLKIHPLIWDVVEDFNNWGFLQGALEKSYDEKAYTFGPSTTRGKEERLKDALIPVLAEIFKSNERKKEFGLLDPYDYSTVQTMIRRAGLPQKKPSKIWKEKTARKAVKESGIKLKQGRPAKK
jgi:hypothetical protein